MKKDYQFISMKGILDKRICNVCGFEIDETLTKENICIDNILKHEFKNPIFRCFPIFFDIDKDVK